MANEVQDLINQLENEQSAILAENEGREFDADTKLRMQAIDDELNDLYSCTDESEYEE